MPHGRARDAGTPPILAAEGTTASATADTDHGSPPGGQSERIRGAGVSALRISAGRPGVGSPVALGRRGHGRALRADGQRPACASVVRAWRDRAHERAAGPRVRVAPPRPHGRDFALPCRVTVARARSSSRRCAHGRERAVRPDHTPRHGRAVHTRPPVGVRRTLVPVRATRAEALCVPRGERSDRRHADTHDPPVPHRTRPPHARTRTPCDGAGRRTAGAHRLRRVRDRARARGPAAARTRQPQPRSNRQEAP